MKCGSCGTESAGPYCAGCGARLDSGECAHCGAALQPGARYCTQCGNAVAAGRRGAAGGGSSKLPYVVAAGAAAFVVAAVAIATLRSPEVSPGTEALPVTAPFAGGEPAGSPPPLTGTPREQADRLFNRIMQEREAGNLEGAEFFLPMALTAYQQAEPLDHDGLYHLSLLRTMAGDAEAGRASAERILADSPRHLLGLASAAEAAAAAGDEAAARDYYQRFLAAYDEEREREVVEYRDHAPMLPGYREQAQAYVGG